MWQQVEGGPTPSRCEGPGEGAWTSLKVCTPPGRRLAPREKQPGVSGWGQRRFFDDDERICRDWFGKGMQTFALMSGKSHHNYLPARVVFKDFVEAVAEYIDGKAPC